MFRSQYIFFRSEILSWVLERSQALSTKNAWWQKALFWLLPHPATSTGL